MQHKNSLETDLLKDTLALILRTQGKHVLNPPENSSEDFSLKCERLAKEVLFTSTEEEQNRTHKEIRRLLSQTIKEEAQAYFLLKREVNRSLSGFIEQLKRALGARLELDSDVIRTLQEAERSASTNDLATIKTVIKTMGENVRASIFKHREEETERFAKLESELRGMRSQLRETTAKLSVDTLTGLFNRKALDNFLAFLIYSYRKTFSVFMIDLDHFKEINDNFGHLVGDLVLQAVSKTLVRTFLRKDDFVARYGGEEFVAICKGTGKDEAQIIGERTRKSVENMTVDVKGVQISVTCSIGFTIFRESDLAHTILERADMALYRAKRTGRNRVVSSGPDD